MTEKTSEIELEQLQNTMKELSAKLIFLGNFFRKSISKDKIASALDYGQGTAFYTVSLIIRDLLTDYYDLPINASRSEIEELVDKDFKKAINQINNVSRAENQLTK